MDCFVLKPALLLMQASLIMGLVACQSSAVEQVSQPLTALSSIDATKHQQLIVKFKIGTYRCDVADIARLSAQAGVRLELVRPMSGNSCVIRQVQTRSGDFMQGQQLLRQHPAIEFVEVDEVVRTM